ncbi:MAG: response regulator transcription factor [Myxococcaceae bacterium]|nr:response regulator transcription factor [Myxococcaceae bacterium]
MKRVLLVDDDQALSGVVSTALEEEGFHVTQAHDGRAGFETFKAGIFDVVLLDVLMPELDGLDVCRRVRQVSQVPIIFLTSRAEEVDLVTGLELGADDYLTKPFGVRELVARMRAIERRLNRGKAEPGTQGEVLSRGELEVDLGRFEARWKNQPVAMTRSELLVLAALTRQAGQVLSRDRLIDLARGGDAVITERTIDTFIKRIRQKLRSVDDGFDEIETVIGVGYRLKAQK